MKWKPVSLLLAGTMALSLSACGSQTTDTASSASEAVSSTTAAASGTLVAATTEATTDDEKTSIESALNLANNEDQEWTYDADNDAWIMSIVCAVTNPEIEDEQGVSVAVPGAYVTGIDTDGDGKEDVTSADASGAVKGALVIDYDAEITSENGQVYTAATAPTILNTGAAGYSEQTNQTASGEYAKDGYINVACGNRGKQSTVTDSDGNTVYTGDAPDCLVDQKNAARYVKYNQLLGNLPGSTEYWVSTGGSGGGAHAAMFAATSNNSDYYDYEIEAGAVGVYRNEDGTYSTTVDIDGTETELSDGAWGCIAYSAITSLAEADMDMAFEYYMDTDYDFNTDFQKQLASYLSEEYMEYINDQNLSVSESEVGFDLNEDGDTEDTVDLTIEYDETKYADTNGYGGTYLTLYLDEFEQNLQWYLDNLDYAEGWTWFDADGNALSDEEVAAMTSEDKAQAFIEGRYAKSETGNASGAPGGMGNGTPPDMASGTDSGTMPSGEAPSGSAPSGMAPSDNAGTDSSSTNGQMVVGTPDQGTTQASGSGVDSSNYSSYSEMLSAYESDIASVEEGDDYGNNQVDLYNPLNYIGDEDTDAPVWTRIVMGASEGDMSMFASLNMQIAWLNSGTDAEIEWQWDGGHVPSEVLGESLSLYVDEMYGKYVDGAVAVTKPEAEQQTENGTATEATGTDISSWVSYTDGTASFSLSDAVSYRTAGASKATPGFDVMDYGQETYEFGSADQDARHFDKYVLQALQDHQSELEPLFNAGSSDSATTDSTDSSDSSTSAAS